MPEKATAVRYDESRVEAREFKQRRHGQYRTHLVAKVLIKSGRMVRFPGETLCGIAAPKKSDGLASPFCQGCLDTGVKHELVMLEELPK